MRPRQGRVWRSMPLLGLVAARTVFSVATLKFSLLPNKDVHLSPLLLAPGSGSGSGSGSGREFPSSRGDTGVCHCYITYIAGRTPWHGLCSLRVSPARTKDRVSQQSPSHITEHQTSSADHSRLQQLTSGRACPQTGSCSASMLPSGSLHVSEQHAHVISRAMPMIARAAHEF